MNVQLVFIVFDSDFFYRLYAHFLKLNVIIVLLHFEIPVSLLQSRNFLFNFFESVNSKNIATGIWIDLSKIFRSCVIILNGNLMRFTTLEAKFS